MTAQNALHQVLKFLMVTLMAIMCILVFLNVVLRYGFNSNIVVTEEVSRYMFVWLTFLGSITAFARNRHVQVTLFLSRMSERPRLLVLVLGQVAMLACCVMIAIGCWQLGVLNLRNILPVSGIPVAMLYFAGLPFAVLVAVMLVARILRDLRALFGGAGA
ncbi:MAG: TRAP transporter small permease subunit [Tropicimonas sp.]|uniref:TRAP transporter small permease subunit n=1 Tax=Tropicimonas sp. TaxID=2067044 RepID=UPI003A859D41